MTDIITTIPVESAGDRYARQTRNAVVFIALVMAVSIIAGIIVGVNAVSTLNKIANPAPPASAQCFNATDPSTFSFPVC
jgi:hypothetical protein